MEDKFAIYLTYGEKGQGKSLSQAKDALELFDDYYYQEKRYPELKKRIYFGNQKFSDEIEKQELVGYKNKDGVPIRNRSHLYYWSNPKELRWCPRISCWIKEPYHPVHDTDVGHDEIGKDLSASTWAETPRWFKQIFSHLRKRGNRYFANTQVYEDIDIAFRRQIDFAYKIEKIFGNRDISASTPPPRFVWGIISKKEFDPRLLEWERDPEKRDIKAGYGGFFFIRKRYVNAYNTKDELPPYKPDTLEHVEVWCENPDCKLHGKNFGKPRMEHYKI